MNAVLCGIGAAVFGTAAGILIGDGHKKIGIAVLATWAIILAALLHNI